MKKKKKATDPGEQRPIRAPMRWLYLALFLSIGIFVWSNRWTTRETSWSEFYPSVFRVRYSLHFICRGSIAVTGRNTPTVQSQGGS